MIAEVGTTITRNSKQGGGEYTVIGHLNCERCETLCEDREWSQPSKAHRKKGHYYQNYYWCEHCGLYQPNEASKKSI